MKRRMHAKLVMAFSVVKAQRYTKAKSYCTPPISFSHIWDFADSLTIFIVLHLKAGRRLQSRTAVEMLQLVSRSLSNRVFKDYAGCYESGSATRCTLVYVHLYITHTLFHRQSTSHFVLTALSHANHLSCNFSVCFQQAGFNIIH